MAPAGFSAIRKLLRELPRSLRANRPALICGPCTVESRWQLEQCAHVGRTLGALALRGGAFKLRTRAESFHGLGVEGWELLRAISSEAELAAISEVTSASQVATARVYLDYLQIGARSMWNFELLEAAAQSGRAVVLKRGLGASTEEWISAALRLVAYGADDVILCERGMPAYGWPSRNVVDLSTLLLLASESPVPLWLDVSHSAGERSVVSATLRHARFLPIDAVMVEVHPEPEQSTCDAAQAIGCAELEAAWTS